MDNSVYQNPLITRYASKEMAKKTFLTKRGLNSGASFGLPLQKAKWNLA
jgi:hypothetical protein